MGRIVENNYMFDAKQIQGLLLAHGRSIVMNIVMGLIYAESVQATGALTVQSLEPGITESTSF